MLPRDIVALRHGALGVLYPYVAGRLGHSETAGKFGRQEGSWGGWLAGAALL